MKQIPNQRSLELIRLWVSLSEESLESNRSKLNCPCTERSQSSTSSYISWLSLSQSRFLFHDVSSLKYGSGSGDSHTAQRVPISRSSFSLYQSSRQRISLFHPFSSTWNSRFHASPIHNREFSSSKNNSVANIPASTYPLCSLRIDRLTIPLLPFFVLLSSLVAWSINIPDSPSLAILKETHSTCVSPFPFLDTANRPERLFHWNCRNILEDSSAQRTASD